MTGIYKITNIINNKIYIGSTKNFNKRKSHHLSLLKRLKHGNRHIQNSFNKYGESNFKFEILEECEINTLIKKEQYYIDTLNPYYNIKRIAESCLGVKRSKETCDKIRLANTGKKQTELHKYNQSINRKDYKGKIYQYNKQMNLIKIWDSTIANIAKDLNIKRKRISECLNGRNKSSFGFIWKFEKEVTIA